MAHMLLDVVRGSAVVNRSALAKECARFLTRGVSIEDGGDIE